MSTTTQQGASPETQAPESNAPEAPAITLASAATPKTTYPNRESKIVRLVRKQQASILPEENVGYNTATDYVVTIGGAFAPGSSVALGRTIWNSFDEENRIMAMVIPSAPTSQDWQKVLNDYWENYQVKVPFEGLDLEVGMLYQSADDPGTPLNPTQYVLWRYCLKYNRVANDIKDINKSPRILFALVSATEEIKRKTDNIRISDEALIARLELVQDETRARAAVAVLTGDMQGESERSFDQIQIILFKEAQDNPSRFTYTVKDKALLEKSFVNACLRYNLLRMPEHSDIIIYGDSQSLGNMNAAIAYLNDPAGAATRTELSAKLQTLRRA